MLVSMVCCFWHPSCENPYPTVHIPVADYMVGHQTVVQNVDGRPDDGYPAPIPWWINITTLCGGFLPLIV